MLILYGMYFLTGIIILVRWRTAARNIAHVRLMEHRAPKPPLNEITVVQPILGGDPTLSENLAANIAMYPHIHFLWLIDVDDAVGMEAAERALKSAPHRDHQNVEVARVPKGPPVQNPKVFKLSWALSRCKETLVVLDDDCQLRPGSLERLISCLCYADLATGIPFYLEKGNLWSQLLAKFPNGQSALTYFSSANFARSRTINGMYYATTRSALNTIGGFAAIAPYLCDDYELAKRYLRKNMAICQSSAQVNIFTSLPNGRSYFLQMQRWAFFSVRQVTELFSPQAIWWVVFPTVLPPLCLLAALALNPWTIFVAVALLVAKAETAYQLRRTYFSATRRGRINLEILTDLLLPVFVLIATFTRSVRWRDKVFVSDRKVLRWHT